MNTRTDLPHWSLLWSALDARGDSAAWHARLVANYSEPARHYHTLDHLHDCLLEFDAVQSVARQPALIELALWFHDAVYDPRSSANEEASAQLAGECLEAADVAEETTETVRRFILCTKDHQPGDSKDAALLIDIDLATLGQDEVRFLRYEREIRAEYAWVPEAIYRQKRREILSGFMQRPALFRTTPFRVRYEQAARTNLQAALKRLE